MIHQQTLYAMIMRLRVHHKIFFIMYSCYKAWMMLWLYKYCISYSVVFVSSFTGIFPYRIKSRRLQDRVMRSDSGKLIDPIKILQSASFYTCK